MKKLLCFILSAFFVLSPLSLCFADNSKSYDATCPYIKVVGLMSSDIYVDPSLGEDSETVWPPNTKTLVKSAVKAIPAIAAVVITKDYDKFSDRFIPLLSDVLSPTFLDNNGEVPNKTGIIWSYPPKEEITKDCNVSFEYDWRVDPMQVAGDLNNFIDYVLKYSGSDKVVLECHSYGGVIGYSYCALYGTSKIKSILFNASAVYGETFCGELTLGQMNFNPEALTEFLKAAWCYEDGESFLNGLFSVLYKTGFTKWLCNIFNKGINGMGDRFWHDIIYPMFGTWPSIWSMVNNENYAAGFNHVFNEIFKNDGINRSKLIEKIESFNTDIRSKRETILDEINKNCNMYVVARYGFSSMFITNSWKNANDMIVDVKYSSFGATCSLYGEKLSDDYLKNAKSEFISPNKDIDASTCRYPTQTWFIDNLVHMRSFDNVDEFFATLLYSEEQATVSTFSQYPRFMYFDENDRTLKY